MDMTLTNGNNNASLMGLLQQILARLDVMDERMDTMDARLDRLVHHNRASDSYARRRKLMPQLPMPFIVGDMPPGLPPVRRMRDIAELTKANVIIYLRGYGVEFNPRQSKIDLADILNLTLGYYY